MRVEKTMPGILPEGTPPKAPGIRGMTRTATITMRSALEIRRNHAKRPFPSMEISHHDKAGNVAHSI
ncbi:MAG: hypothetical protein QCH35_03345 [Methanomicrobiaceae archaeon]|nr:hypothetical protein [Methanomicrobiaceae archaeon]